MAGAEVDNQLPRKLGLGKWQAQRLITSYLENWDLGSGNLWAGRANKYLPQEPSLANLRRGEVEQNKKLLL